MSQIIRYLYTINRPFALLLYVIVHGPTGVQGREPAITNKMADILVG